MTPEGPALTWFESEKVFSDLPDLEAGVESGATETFRFPIFGESLTRLLARRLDAHLLQLDLIFIRDSVYAAVREMITNSVRANAKRLYFREKGARLQDPSDYNKHIKGFKAYYVERLPMLGDAMIREGLLATMVIRQLPEGLRLEFSNNRGVTPQERQRIVSRIAEAQRFKDLGEAFHARGDETEGAGLGLIMTLMMLKADGLGPGCLMFKGDEANTTFVLDLPRLELRRGSEGVKKAEPIVQKVTSLPSFPRTITEIQMLLKNPESSMNQIAGAVKRDPGLSGNLLKLANSAAFRRGAAVENLDRAIAVIGLKDLGDILFTLGSKQILERQFSAYQAIADRSNLSAFYAKQVAQHMGLDRDDVGHVVSGALLHDLGEIILLSLERSAMGKIRGWAQTKELSSSLSMEEAAFGITHTRLSGLLAEKWLFPPLYAAAMEYHHRPFLVPEEYRNVIWPIYLADQMLLRETSKVAYSIPPEVLERTRIEGPEAFHRFHAKIRQSL